MGKFVKNIYFDIYIVRLAIFGKSHMGYEIRNVAKYRDFKFFGNNIKEVKKSPKTRNCPVRETYFTNVITNLSTVHHPITCLFGSEKRASYGVMRQVIATYYDFRKLKPFQLIF